MSGGWAGSTGRARTNTRQWKTAAAAAVARDITCRLAYPGICTGRAEQADHIISPLHGGTDDPTNLRGVCTPCHARRSSEQGNAARPRERRDPAPHPGLAPRTR